MRGARIVATTAAATLAAGVLAGCVTATPIRGQQGAVSLMQDVDAKKLPVDAADLARAEQGSTSFGLALLRELGAGNGDMVYSPQTLVDLLGMLLPAAHGQTAAQLSSTLGTAGLSPDTAAAAFGRIDATARTDASQGSNTLDVASDLWLEYGFMPDPAYLAALGGAFGTGVHGADFARDPDGAEQSINAQVASETHGYIRQLFAPHAFDVPPLLVLTDAVYLDARWAHPFDPNQTSDLPFYPSAGATQQASTMDADGTYKYAAGHGWQAVELPYSGGRLAMDVLLPAKGPGTLAALRNGLTADSLDSMLSALRSQQVEVQLPKFTTDYSPGDLDKDLSALGLGALFQQADLSGMSGPKQVYVSQVVEKAHIQVGEKGTVAAAAAGGAVGATAARVPAPVSFTADHPFLYLIRDLSTGQLLFAGQVASL